jgi:hypothetical protein
MGPRYVEAFIVAVAWRIKRLEESSDFGRQDVLISVTLGEGRAEATFREPEAVMGCSVKVANSLFPGLIDRRASLVVRYCPIQVAELRATERELGQRNSRPPERPLREGHVTFARLRR